jgi:hypothetical protein
MMLDNHTMEHTALNIELSSSYNHNIIIRNRYRDYDEHITICICCIFMLFVFIYVVFFTNGKNLHHT